MWDVLSGVSKNGMGCFVPGCFVLHSCHSNINNLQLSDMDFDTDWQFWMFKRGKDNGHDTGKRKFPNSFLPYFQ